MKNVIKLDDGTELPYEVFLNPETRDLVVQVEHRSYRLYATPDKTAEGLPVFYTMVRIGRHQRSLRGSAERMFDVVANIHAIYNRYESRVRRLKEEAQSARDTDLNRLAERYQ